MINWKGGYTFETTSILAKWNRVSWNCSHGKKYGTFQLSGLFDAIRINIKVKIETYTPPLVYSIGDGEEYVVHKLKRDGI